MPHQNVAAVKDSVLLVVDVQSSLLNVMLERERTLGNILLLLRLAQRLGLPVLATEQAPEKLGSTHPDILQVAPGLKPMAKLSFSCMGAGGFQAALEDAGRNAVLMCGIETHVCVGQTCHDLLHEGYQVHVIADATSARKEIDWRLGIEKMRQSGAIVTTTEAVTFELLRTAEAEAFKEFQEMIKAGPPERGTQIPA
jgi:nicotinamidase-related amidase